MTNASIIIPAHNKVNEIGYVLQALKRQSIACNRYEVIVVDHDSDDGTVTLVESFKEQLDLKYLRVERKHYGPAAPRNEGIEIASFDIIILLDADVVPCWSFVEKHISAHAGNNRRLILGEILGLGLTWDYWRRFNPGNSEVYTIAVDTFLDGKFSENLPRDWRAKWLQNRSQQLGFLPAPWTFAWGGNLSFHKDLISEIGNLDESFNRHEDIEFGYRAFRNGADFDYCSEARVLHLPHERNYDMQWNLEHSDAQTFLEKFPCPEVELLGANLSNFTCLDVNAWLPKVKKIPKTRAIQNLGREALEDLQRALQATNAFPRMLIGCGEGSVINYVNASYATEVNEESYQVSTSTHPQVLIHNLLGIALPLSSSKFGAAIISDICDNLPSELLRFMIRECSRVSKRVFMLSERIGPRHTEEFDWFESDDVSGVIRVRVLADLRSSSEPYLSLYEIVALPKVVRHEWSLE